MASQAEARELPFSSWVTGEAADNPDMATGAGESSASLSMERRGLWAMAARNLATSLLHGITPAGCSQQRTGGAGPGCRISLIGAQPRRAAAEALNRATRAQTKPAPTQDGLWGTMLQRSSWSRKQEGGHPPCEECCPVPVLMVHWSQRFPAQCRRPAAPSGGSTARAAGAAERRRW